MEAFCSSSIAEWTPIAATAFKSQLQNGDSFCSQPLILQQVVGVTSILAGDKPRRA
jgi:hypothetical protein